MIEKIKFNELPDFSKLFIKQVKELTSPTNLFFSKSNSNSIEDKISELSDFQIDDKLIEIIAISNRKLKSSGQQRENISLLQKNNAYVCCGTIKAAFLGGNSNILLKILSVFIQSEIQKCRFKKINFVPIIWINDDVHDNLESSQTLIFSKNGELINFSCSANASKSDRTVIHRKLFNQEIYKIIDEIALKLPESDSKTRICEFIRNAYQSNDSWSFASAKFLNSAFKYLGILFIFSSEIRKAGFFNNLIAKELSERGKTNELIKNKQDKLKKFKIEIPDKSQSYNLNIHFNDQVNRCEKKESMKFTDYSPNIMLRSVFEDSLLPVVSRICSPSEFVYSLLLDDVYNHFQVVQPVHIPRYSATFIDTSTSDFIDDTGTDLKEIISGYKRLQKMFDYDEKIKKAVNWLYPRENLQERILALVNILTASGKQLLIRTAKKLMNTEPTKHLIIKI